MHVFLVICKTICKVILEVCSFVTKYYKIVVSIKSCKHTAHICLMFLYTKSCQLLPKLFYFTCFIPGSKSFILGYSNLKGH